MGDDCYDFIEGFTVEAQAIINKIADEALPGEVYLKYMVVLLF